MGTPIARLPPVPVAPYLMDMAAQEPGVASAISPAPNVGQGVFNELARRVASILTAPAPKPQTLAQMLAPYGVSPQALNPAQNLIFGHSALASPNSRLGTTLENAMLGASVGPSRTPAAGISSIAQALLGIPQARQQMAIQHALAGPSAVQNLANQQAEATRSQAQARYYQSQPTLLRAYATAAAEAQNRAAMQGLRAQLEKSQQALATANAQRAYERQQASLALKQAEIAHGLQMMKFQDRLSKAGAGTGDRTLTRQMAMEAVTQRNKRAAAKSAADKAYAKRLFGAESNYNSMRKTGKIVDPNWLLNEKNLALAGRNADYAAAGFHVPPTHFARDPQTGEWSPELPGAPTSDNVHSSASSWNAAPGPANVAHAPQSAAAAASIPVGTIRHYRGTAYRFNGRDFEQVQ